jgi:hypothetical protein
LIHLSQGLSQGLSIPLCHNQYKNISPINKMTFSELLNDFILSMTMPGAKDGEAQ